MKKVTIAAGILLTLGIILSSCATPGNVAKTEWSEYTVIPSKNYTVVGTIVIREPGSRTLNADLMDKAIAMGAHDIINVRVDFEASSNGKKILAATAVAIKYGDQTLVDKTTSTSGGSTVSGEIIIRNGSASVPSGDDSSGKRKKFLGIF